MKVIKTKVNYATLYSSFDINSIEIEDTAPFDIFIKKDKDYMIIIEAGTLISQKLYAKLKKQEDLYIAKKDEEKQILSCETLKYYIRYNQGNPKKRLQLLYEVNNQLFDIYLNNKDNKIDLNCVELIIKSIIFLIKDDDDFLKTTMPHFVNDYSIPNHSLHVSIYAIKLGNLLNFTKEQLLQIGTAALIHDVGYKNIDNAITTKDSPLTPQETKQIQRHSQHSVDIIKHNHILDPYIINAVMHHHERYDGSGYPEGIEEEDISDFASILAICDVFDALTNSRPHRTEYSSFDALKMMMKDTSMVNKFNQKYLHMALTAL